MIATNSPYMTRHPCLRRLLACLGTVLFAAGMWAQTASPFVSGAWSGNVTSTSATACIRLNASGLRARLAVSGNDQLSSPVFSVAETSAATAGNVVSLDIVGLQPNTTYYYGFEINGTLRTETLSRGRFRTFPQGAGNLRIALIGDMDHRDATSVVAAASAAVIAEQPHVLLLNGDLHYYDLTTNVAEDYRAAIDNSLKDPNLGAMFRSAAVAYNWDDHDFSGGDNSNSTGAGSAVIRAVFRDYVRSEEHTSELQSH